MTRAPLVASELELVLSVLRQHPEIESVTLFGSRAKGTHSDRRRTGGAAPAVSL
jgi:predicted nucleotidyltransferase